MAVVRVTFAGREPAEWDYDEDDFGIWHYSFCPVEVTPLSAGYHVEWRADGAFLVLPDAYQFPMEAVLAQTEVRSDG